MLLCEVVGVGVQGYSVRGRVLLCEAWGQSEIASLRVKGRPGVGPV